MSFLIQSTYNKKNQTGVKGELTIRVNPEYHDLMKAFLVKKFKKVEGDEIEIPWIVNPDISKRSLDANACMHHWYTVEAQCLNAGQGGSGQHEITAWERYEDDLRLYCPKDNITIKREFYNVYRRKFRHTHILQENGDYLEIQVWKTSSHFSIREMAHWINRIINRIATYGVPLSVDLQGKILSDWIELQKWLSKNKIILHSEEKCTKDEYKNKTPICEASGEYIGNEGEVAHIVAVGMGGHEEPEKDCPGNWLHLKTEIHRGLIHGKGWRAFLKKYPWLKYKCNLAMKIAEENKEPEQGELI